MIAFVRHGQTAINQGGRIQGRFDAPLTDLGRAQAASVAAVLAKEAPVRIVTSPLLRARATADAIASCVDGGIDVETDERLIELDYGEWDQLSFADLPADAMRAWRASPSFAPPGGESLETVTARVVDFCTERVEQWRDELLIAVSHVSPIKAALCWALGIDERASWRMQLDLAAISRIGCRPDGAPYLASFNETAHLAVSSR